MKLFTWTFPAVLTLTALGLATVGCQQSAPPQQTSTAPAPAQPAPANQSTETTTATKSVEVTPTNPADPDSSGQKMVKKETTTVKKQQ